jgi:hypothetical protein
VILDGCAEDRARARLASRLLIEESMKTRSRILTSLLAALLLGSGGCDGTIEVGEEDTGAAYEPDDDEGRQIFKVGMKPGTKVEVCKTGGVGLNLRTGPSKQHKVIRVMGEGHDTTITGVSGSWYKLDDGGYSYEYYLCPRGSTGSTSSSSSSSGSAGSCAGSFTHPAPGRPVTSEFGPRWGKMHNGIDLGLPLGTSVHAAQGGVVEFAGWMSGYGYAVDINHCGKYTTRYAHLSSFVAHHGDKVGKGQTIAKSGSTGNSTGPHLHFEIRLGGRWGTAVNPRKYISF